MSINKVMLIGELTKDVVYKYAKTTIALLNLKTTESWVDRESGENKQAHQFHRVVIFGSLADECQKKQIREGSKIYVEGMLSHRSYDDVKTGVKKYITEVKLSGFRSALQLLDSKGEAKAELEIGEIDEPKPHEAIIPVELDKEFDDDIPF